MPTPALLVWLPQNRIAYLKRWIEMGIAEGGTGRDDYRAGYERLTGETPTPHLHHPQHADSDAIVHAAGVVYLGWVVTPERLLRPSKLVYPGKAPRS